MTVGDKVQLTKSEERYARAKRTAGSRVEQRKSCGTAGSRYT